MSFLDLAILLRRMPDHQLAQAALAFYGELRRSMLGVLYFSCPHCVEEFAGGPVEELSETGMADETARFRAMADDEDESLNSLDAFNEEMRRFPDWTAHEQWLEETDADDLTTWETTWGLVNKIARQARSLN